ncbi:MAG: hypothetical protein ABIL58_13940 [Pseudomonadota bacterium]
MALLINTDIEARVHRSIQGHIARIGGTVNQLMTYDGCTVDDLNLPDGGFGKIRSGVRSILSVKKHITQEWRFRKHGWREPRDRKALLLDIHDAYRRPDLLGRYDATVSSNMIEHSPNPIWLLINIHLITKPGGWQYHAIPHYRYTYDMYREPTPLAHLIADFESGADASDTTHNDDYYRSAVVEHGWQKAFHEKYPVTYPFIHFHVFDEQTVAQLFSFVFEDVVNDVIKTEVYSDNLVLCRNRLRPEFAAAYGDLVQRYRDGAMGSRVYS